ncbi:MAG: Holliday junction resolvase RuvX [Clostridiales bacterium]|nr:Holliday junction resolvase RuvX [Clostridiales bacterium]
MKIMAIDYGDAHTGIAVSDMSRTIAGYTTVINERSREKLLNKVIELIKTHNIAEIVVGKPLNMNGTVGERAEKCMTFAEQLRERTDCKVVLWDERRTSVDANRILSDAGKKRGKQKKLVDAVAASLILQGYLDFIAMKSDR